MHYALRMKFNACNILLYENTFPIIVHISWIAYLLLYFDLKK